MARLDYRLGEWMVRPSLNRIERDGSAMDLEPKLMDLLVCLSENPGEVVSKDEILDRVWRVEHVSDGTLSHAVADLRKALGDDARHPRYVETIRKRGYRLVASVEFEPPPVRPNGKSDDRRWLVRALVSGVALVALAGFGWLALQFGNDEPAIPARIAILPFENLGGESNQSFAAGLTDEIISRLAVVRGLQVVSRTTAFNFDTTGKTAQEIGDELKVEYILEGAVRWSDDSEQPIIRITPQLIRVDEDGHVWSGRFDRHPEDVLDVQSEIAQQIVAQLDLRLAREESDVLEKPPTDSPVAYRAYLEALERRGSIDSRDILTAAQMYRRAVEADPGFAQAWAGLAEANGAYYRMGYDREGTHCEAADSALQRARMLAPEAPDTMRASAFFEYHCRRDVAVARAAFEQTLEKWPGDGRAMTGLAFVCRRMGRWEDAEKWFRRSLELDPRNPFILWNFGQTLISDHKYDAGLAAVDRALELAPDTRPAYFAKCLALWLGWGDTHGVTQVLDRWPGERDSSWHEYAFRNACYSGDLQAACRLADEAPPGLFSNLNRCLAATLTDGPDAVVTCAEAAEYYRTVSEGESDELPARLLLASAYSLAGRHVEAEAEAADVVATQAFETDAYGYTEALIVQAQVLGRAGRIEDAVTIVERLLGMPSHLSSARLRIDPEWADLRGHPRIESIIQNADLPPR